MLFLNRGGSGMNGNFLFDTNALIAAQAMINDFTLITADKGFQKMDGLKIINFMNI